MTRDTESTVGALGSYANEVLNLIVKESGANAADGWGTWHQLLRSILEARPLHAVVAVVIYRGMC